MIILAEYGVALTLRFPMVKAGVADFADSADWTPATGDTKLSKDGGNVANATNNPALVGGTGAKLWSLALTATEMQAAEVLIQVVDSATKAVEDQSLIIHTYGHASARHKVNLNDAVRAGLTALPNAAAQATGGVLTALRGGTAQGGAAGSITLDSGASATDDYYNHTLVQIVAGAGAGQSRFVTDYAGATRVATVDGNWAVNPDNTSVFVIHAAGAIPGASAPTAAQVADAVWDEAVADHQAAGSSGKVLNTRVTAGAGALQRTIGITVGGNPLEGASVWLATDSAGANVVAGPLVTSSLGLVTVLLDAGAYYVWVQKDGYNALLAQSVTLS